MMIPIRDAKLSQFTAHSLKIPVHFLTAVKGPINSINNCAIAKKIVLSTCADKDYVIAFSDYDAISRYKAKTSHPYFVNTAPISEVLQYGKSTHTSLLVMHKKVWYKLDPGSSNVSIHSIEFGIKI